MREPARREPARSPASHVPLLEVRALVCHFPSRREGRRGREGPVQAVRGVSFGLDEGECLAVVGESGSGKTTLARSVLRLVEPTGGQVLFRGENVLALDGASLIGFRRKAQMVFQDPFGSLNPRLRTGSMLEEILKVHGLGEPGEERRSRVASLLDLVGLHSSHLGRYPHELSGGQRQRLGIARALALEPELLVLDEPVSALDLSVQAQILNLLQDLRERLSLTLLLIAHDLAVVRHMADRVGVMYAGQVVELASASDLFRAPSHPYTRGLMSAARLPRGVRAAESRWDPLPGGLPDPARPLPGCAYHPRCPHPDKDRECVTRPFDPGLPDWRRGVLCWKEMKAGSWG